MKKTILKATALLSLTAFSLSSQAAYTYYLSMENGSGAGLPKGSIAFVTKTSTTPPVDNGSTPTPEEPTPPEDNGGDTTPTEPEEPFDPLAQCNTNATKISQILQSSSHSDVTVTSYDYRMSFTETGGEKERCIVTLQIPNYKMSPCVSDNSYRTSVTSYIGANFDIMQPVETTWRFTYAGSCSK